MKNWPKFYSLLLTFPFLPLRLHVFIGEMQRVEEYEDKESWQFLNLNSPLIFKLDLMWIFSSDLQLIGVLITKYNLSMTKLKIMINLSVVTL